MLEEYRNLSKIEEQLISEMEQISIIDCHEHLMSEEERIQTDVDVFTFFSHYIKYDLLSSGMPADKYELLYEPGIPLELRWQMVEPYWNKVRHTSYARSALLSAKKFYGADDINASTYQEISQRIKEANKPGLYQKVLKDACNIDLVLGQINVPYREVDRRFFAPVIHTAFCEDSVSWSRMNRPFFNAEARIRSLDDYLEAAESFVAKKKSQGAVALKMVVREMNEPSRQDALQAFDLLQSGSVERFCQINPLYDYIIDHVASLGSKYDLVIAVHTGYWGDFRKLKPTHLIPLIERHPATKFDLFHLGYPYVRESLMLGKSFKNVSLNFCWTHIISQKFALEAMSEAIDLVPANKILAFGADYRLPVEKVYGHLIMARENIARALASRIEAGQMSFQQAMDLAQKWLRDNPKEIYQI